MDEFFRPGVLLVAVLLTALFPLSVWHLYSYEHTSWQPVEVSSPEEVSEIPLAFRTAEQRLTPQLQQQVVQKRFYAIQSARKSGKDEYSFRVKIPPPPISGQ